MILIASCYNHRNYGSVLQAYATQKALDNLNIENKTICQSGFTSHINKAKIKYYIRHFYNTDAFVAQLKRYTIKFHAGISKEYAKKTAERKDKFSEFVDNYFSVTDPCSFDYLTELCADATAVIVGSDQLWLPSNIYADYYTLNFAPDNVKKISYATSFGVSKLDSTTINRCKRFLNRFDYISVREKSGKEIVESITSKPCTLVCDPTLLLEEIQWSDIQSKDRIVDEKYIFCYFLGNNRWHREWATALRKITGLKIVTLIHLDEYIKSDDNYADYAPFDINPGDFINLIKNAECICTDSFHATMFSLIYKKTFFSFKRFCEAHSASTNSRLYSILNLVNLPERIINEDVPPENALNLAINYDDVIKTLCVLRNDSIEWLEQSLGDG